MALRSASRDWTSGSGDVFQSNSLLWPLAGAFDTGYLLVGMNGVPCNLARDAAAVIRALAVGEFGIQQHGLIAVRAKRGVYHCETSSTITTGSLNCLR